MHSATMKRRRRGATEGTPRRPSLAPDGRVDAFVRQMSGAMMRPSTFLHVEIGPSASKWPADVLPEGGLKDEDDEGPTLPSGLTSAGRGVLNSKLRKYVMLEVRDGGRRLFHASGAELLRMVAEASAPPYMSRNENTANEGVEPRDSFSGDCLVSVLTYRDLRQVLSEGRQVPSIRVRRGCIVLCLPPVTALLLRHTVLVLVTEDLIIDQLVEALRELSLHNLDYATTAQTDISGLIDPSDRSGPDWGGYAFEFGALEVLLAAAFEQLNADIEHFEKRIEVTKDHVQKRQTKSADLEALQELKTPLEKVGDRVLVFDKSFDALLESPEELKRMELTRYYYEPELYEVERKGEPPNADLEILLEYFDQEMELYMSRVKTLRVQIESIERMMSLRMSIIRNMLIRFDLAVSLISLGTAFGTCASGIFGMNLLNGWEDSYVAFVVTASLVSALSIGSGFLVFALNRKTSV